MIYTGINEIQGEYSLILADPPWDQQKSLRKCRPNQHKEFDYPTMDLYDIKEHLQIATEHTTENSILFMWTIDKYLIEAQDIAEDLGYKLHARMIWDKTNGIAPAFTVRFAHEYLLYMYKGKFTRPAKEAWGKYTTVMREPLTKHSKKPQISYEIIESLYPISEGHTYLEMYARSSRPGWDSFGNELQKEDKGGVDHDNQIEPTSS